MLDIAICNDNIRELEHLGNLVEDYRNQRPHLDLRVRRFQSAYDLVDCIQAGRTFHIYLLDVHLPRLDGRSPEATVRSLDEDASIICFTTTPAAAYGAPIPSDPVGAEARLCKPVSVGELFPVLDRITGESREPVTQSLTLKTPGGPRSLPLHQVAYVRYRDHTVFCHMADGAVVQSVTLREPFSQITQPLLRDNRFVRVSSSYVANLAFADFLTNRELVMRDGSLITVPRAGLSNLKKTFQDFQQSR